MFLAKWHWLYSSIFPCLVLWYRWIEHYLTLIFRYRTVIKLLNYLSLWLHGTLLFNLCIRNLAQIAPFQCWLLQCAYISLTLLWCAHPKLYLIFHKWLGELFRYIFEWLPSLILLGHHGFEITPIHPFGFVVISPLGSDQEQRIYGLFNKN